MENKVSVKHITRLFQFLLIFEINRFELLGSSHQTINARVGWLPDDDSDYEDEIQDIAWDIQDFDNFEEVLLIIEYLIDHNLVKGDKILVDEVELKSRLGWEKSKFKSALKSLLDLKVDMVDEGRRTDYFFVHF